MTGDLFDPLRHQSDLVRLTDKLTRAAAYWLHNRCHLVIRETGTQRERADVIGFDNSVSYVVEVKASRADFVRDRNKPHRCLKVTEIPSGLGVYRYYFCEKGVIPPEFTGDWGLVYLSKSSGFYGHRVYAEGETKYSGRIIKESKSFCNDKGAEISLLVHAVRVTNKNELGWEDSIGRYWWVQEPPLEAREEGSSHDG